MDEKKILPFDNKRHLLRPEKDSKPEDNNVKVGKILNSINNFWYRDNRPDVLTVIYEHPWMVDV